jgi:hypothetical protein
MRRRREGRKSGWVTDPEGNRLKALAAAKERMIGLPAVEHSIDAG